MIGRYMRVPAFLCNGDWRMIISCTEASGAGGHDVIAYKRERGFYV
ncbi:hypothetical protein ACQRAL_05200 [Lachnospiraceae bacterium SGI.231]